MIKPLFAIFVIICGICTIFLQRYVLFSFSANKSNKMSVLLRLELNFKLTFVRIFSNKFGKSLT